MPIFSKLALPLLLTASLVSALPTLETTAFHPSTHKRHLGVNGTEFEFYQPGSSFETYDDGVDHPLSKRGDVSNQDAAIAYLVSKGVPKDQIKVQSRYDGETASHVYFTQVINGVPVANAKANVSLKDGKVVSYGNSFIPAPNSVAADSPSVDKEAAIRAAESKLGAKFDNFPPKVEYVITKKKAAALAWIVEVRNNDHWYSASVDAHSGEIVNVVDYVAQASYRAIRIQNQDPTTGFEVITNPQDSKASPNGWHNSERTEGNNVVAYYQTKDKTAASSSKGNNYNYKWKPAEAPNSATNLNVARTNAFYVVNKYHDVLYKYGFTEKAFNFQTNNFKKGGAGNDRVEMQVQAPGSNNANFATPPDGRPGHCNMFTWTYTVPNRDGDLSNDIITHELTHGTTNRMTGGGTGACLQTVESGGLGEGWSDSFAFFFEQKSAAIKDFTLGRWVLGLTKGGIRQYPYSTNLKTNPHTYADLPANPEVHAIGEVWASMLYELFASLIKKSGYSPKIEDPAGKQGNIVWFHLVVDALPLQPCNPTFIQARNAIIKADQNRYKGVNKCLIWKAFAKRGLGVDAANYVNGFKVPAGC